MEKQQQHYKYAATRCLSSVVRVYVHIEIFWYFRIWYFRWWDVCALWCRSLQLTHLADFIVTQRSWIAGEVMEKNIQGAESWKKLLLQGNHNRLVLPPQECFPEKTSVNRCCKEEKWRVCLSVVFWNQKGKFSVMRWFVWAWTFIPDVFWLNSCHDWVRQLQRPDLCSDLWLLKESGIQTLTSAQMKPVRRAASLSFRKMCRELT